MSQAGILDIIQNNPNIPIFFVGDNGPPGAAALFNTINILGAGGITTNAEGNTITINGSTVGLQTLSDDIGTVVNPAVNNIQLVGHVVEQGATKFSTVTAGTNLLNINPMSSARWIVDPLGFNGTHTTLVGALASAASGDSILLMPGVYTENYNGKIGVSITAFTNDEITPNVTIIGKCTFTGSGTFSISNISLQTNGDFFLSVTGSSASTVNLTKCRLSATNNTGMSLASSSSSGIIRVQDCTSDISSTGIALFAQSGTNLLLIREGRHTNSGSSSTANTISAGILFLEYCDFLSPIVSSGTSAASIKYVTIDTAVTSTISFTANGSGAHSVIYCRLASGSASALSIGTNNFEAVHNSINSTATNAITGSGIINYSAFTYENTSNLINTATIVRQVLDGGEYKGRTSDTIPSIGMIGEEIRATTALGAAVTLNNGIPGNMTSITLTPGIWDVSAVGGVNGNLTGTLLFLDINTISATLSTRYGDSFVATPTLSNVLTTNIICVPQYRMTVAANTTQIVYAVMQCNFSAGTCTVFGRLSAVRVA